MRRTQKKSRRGNGEGSLTLNKRSGRWQGSVIIGRGENAKPLRLYVSAKRKEDAQDKLDKLRTAQRSGSLSKKDKTKVGEYLDGWLNDVARPSVRSGTLRNYQGLVKNKIKPVLAGYRLTELKALQIQNLFTTLERNGESAYRRQQVHSVLYSALQQAVELQLLPNNPCAAVRSPKLPTNDVLILTKTQAASLLEEASDGRYYALYVVALATGMRQGELFGLKWGDVDLKNGTISVQRSVVEEQITTVQGKRTLRPATGEPKTKSGRRLINLPATATAALRRHRKRMFAEGHMAWVFCDVAGGLLRRSNFIRRQWRPLLEAVDGKLRRGHELPCGFKFHHLRHTAASLRLAQGDHPKVVQEMLGHARISITLDLYSHLMPSLQADSAERFEKALSKMAKA